MKRFFFGLLILFPSAFVIGQKNMLARAFQKFESDSQLKSAISSLYVVNGKTGEVIFEKNATIGLTPGSTQKIITSAAAYDLLGKNFQYKTEFGILQSQSGAEIYIHPSGDPTLGSWRWEQTKEKNTLSRIVTAYKKNIKSFSKIFIQSNGWDYETIPDGWVWQDIGNYFGAGAEALNWRENQYDLILKSGNNVGEKVIISATEPKLYSFKISSLASSGAKGTGDNTTIYYSLTANEGFLRGTIPINENRFIVSGAMPDAKRLFTETLLDSLKSLKKGSASLNNASTSLAVPKILYTEISPPLDSIIYWLNKKSINLYAEALVKTIGYEKANIGSTEKGLEIIKTFWKEKGIDNVELNMLDGSGLSPSNRITTHALVSVLQFAKQQPWFNGFYNSLPEYNGMKMKSGTIRDVKGFAGYHTSKDGSEYTFSFLVNNYNGSTSTLVKKIYEVLDDLK